MTQEGAIVSKLDELADKSSSKSGTTANYIAANQALRNDIFAYIDIKIDPLLQEIKSLKNKLSEVEAKLQEAHARETQMSLQTTDNTSKKDFFIVGSSILRAVRPGDIINGTVSSISGGKIDDVKETIKNLDFTPKTIITQVGGNDLDKQDSSVETVTGAYATMLTETRDKFPESKLIVSGLPPRFKNEEIRTKIKDFNELIETWSNENEIQFINTEEEFELRSGEVDTSAYVMTGEMPKLHLNRHGTIRMLKHIQKQVPEIKLADLQLEPVEVTKTYAQAVSEGQNHRNQPERIFHRRRQGQGDNFTTVRRSRGCFNCGEKNHTVSQCKYSQKIRCYQCHRLGHKNKFCEHSAK